MNSVVVILISGAALVLGYMVYSRLVERWLGVDYSEESPAHTHRDGVDFEPAKHWTVLFGHHFASIAGAAPVLGPVVACMMWGWLPALLWIVIGGIFFGAVHDFCSLVISARNEGRSISDVAEDLLGKPVKIFFQIFVWLALILVVAVFAAFAGKTLAGTPEVVLPTFGLIPVALVIGIMMYRMNMNILVCSMIGVVLLAALIVAGNFLPIDIKAWGIENAADWWTVILLIYAGVASVIPVPLLLQPRDHLAGSILFFGLLFGFVGIFLSQPDMKCPRFIAYTSAAGNLWPMLFVVIACGALSGFHSLVASGTTSKQLPDMKSARPIGYGGMITESALSLLALICVAAGLYWSDPPEGCAHLVYPALAKSDRIKAFGEGYGQLTKTFFGSFGVLIGITMLKTFIMTTLDSATRITRFITSELFAGSLKIKPLNNRYAATIVVIALSGYLALGNYGAIWPIFGASNQLIAAIVLMIISMYLMVRNRFSLFALMPAMLIFVTTIAALVTQVRTFLLPGEGKEAKYMLGGIGSFLLVLGVLVLICCVRVMIKQRAADK